LKKPRHDTATLIKQLHALAQNLWWSWNPRAQAIFESLSPLIWESSNHNPVAVLEQFSETELSAHLGDKDFLRRLTPVLEEFERYGGKHPHRRHGEAMVAYFCAEFGIHECLPFYSGGLGVLAGDHLKSASDLDIPLVGIGLFYRQGYFQQHIDPAGNQQESYPTTDPSAIPVELVKSSDGKPLLCSVTIGTSMVYFQAWRVRVGRCSLYLLDTDVAENAEHFRGLTALAYGGDMNTRIRQEIILGIGGVRFIRALGLRPAVFHMNEGHAAFLTLELLREQLLKGPAKAAAEKAVREQCIFTTHTPVPAGHDRFPADLIEFTLRPYMEGMKLSVPDLMEYGNLPNTQNKTEFTMTILGLKLSRSANGVSKKHGEISRLMWKDLQAAKESPIHPIGYVTNGVHVPSWTGPTCWEFWERHNSHKWKEHFSDGQFWQHVSKPEIVTDEELWALRYELRRELIEFVRTRARQQHAFGGVSGEEALFHLLSFDSLTIGYARRFAPYKRAPLIFSDLTKAQMLFSDLQRPIQIIYAGKAHPRDGEGKDYLRRIIEATRQHPFFGKVIFLENYDMNIARRLVSGCDVWLNTPRRPLEASGTSGQKTAINGGLHLSILDGWWDEAYNGKNGWAIGAKADDNAPPDEVDRRDAGSLYDVLGNDVIPLFYERDKHGIPRKWIARMRNAMRSIIPRYNTHRMVAEYAGEMYFPALRARLREPEKKVSAR
jgi:starch phosphorylase